MPSIGATSTAQSVRRRRRVVVKRPGLRDATPERLRLEEALLDDYLGGLPDPISVSDLAELLAVPRSLIHGRLRRGALLGEKYSTGWVVGIQVNREWIELIRKRNQQGARARKGNVFVPQIVRVDLHDPHALAVLRELTNSGQSAAEAITRLLLNQSS